MTPSSERARDRKLFRSLEEVERTFLPRTVAERETSKAVAQLSGVQRELAEEILQREQRLLDQLTTSVKRRGT